MSGLLQKVASSGMIELISVHFRVVVTIVMQCDIKFYCVCYIIACFIFCFCDIGLYYMFSSVTHFCKYICECYDQPVRCYK